MILGHSERRGIFQESNEMIQKKVMAAYLHHLIPIVCCGESLAEHEMGKTNEIVKNQVLSAFSACTKEQVTRSVIAYEPIWAIGTGKTATKEDANEMTKAIREKISYLYGQMVADRVIIQYGGSVKASNAKELFTMSDIDGGLVGGASLKSKEFADIVNYNNS